MGSKKGIPISYSFPFWCPWFPFKAALKGTIGKPDLLCRLPTYRSLMLFGIPENSSLESLLFGSMFREERGLRGTASECRGLGNWTMMMNYSPGENYQHEGALTAYCFPGRWHLGPCVTKLVSLEGTTRGIIISLKA